MHLLLHCYHPSKKLLSVLKGSRIVIFELWILLFNARKMEKLFPGIIACSDNGTLTFILLNKPLLHLLLLQYSFCLLLYCSMMLFNFKKLLAGSSGKYGLIVVVVVVGYGYLWWKVLLSSLFSIKFPCECLLYQQECT